MDNESTKDHREELLVLFQVTINDLTYFKSTQWTVTNYVLLLLGAVAAVRQFIGTGIMPIERVGLSILSGLVVTAGLAMLSKLEQSVKSRETRLFTVRGRLSAEFNEAWRAGERRRGSYIRSVWFLRSAVLLGGAIVVWICQRA